MSKFYILPLLVAFTALFYIFFEPAEKIQTHPDVSQSPASTQTKDSSDNQDITITYQALDTPAAKTHPADTNSTSNSLRQSVSSVENMEVPNIIASAKLRDAEERFIYVCNEDNSSLEIDKEKRYMRIKGSYGEKKFDFHIPSNSAILRNCTLYLSGAESNISLDFIPLDTLKDDIINTLEINSDNPENFMLQNYEEREERIPGFTPLPLPN